MGIETLNAILTSHLKWLTTSCQEGQRANLRGANLSSADLRDANLRGADLRDANLRGADLRDANLSSADLRDANLRDANLSSADLRDANLSSANLRGADLRDANLSSANLRGADLRDANLRDADLELIRMDFFKVLDAAPTEVPGLLSAIREGRVDGSAYEGECACLVGTIANVKKCAYNEIEGLSPDGSRPIERFFLGISKGHTPENNQFSKIVEGWVLEWQSAREKPA